MTQAERGYINRMLDRKHKELDKIQADAPQKIEQHMKAIWLDGQIFALESVLMEMWERAEPDYNF